MITDYADITYFLKVLFFIATNYYVNIKMLQPKKYERTKYYCLFIVATLIISLICKILKEIATPAIIIYVVVFSSIVYSIITKNKLGYSILVNIISSSINVVILFVAIAISFIIHKILAIENTFIDFGIILVIYLIEIYFLGKIRRIKNGNQYLNLVMLNIGIIILFIVLILTTYKEEITLNLIYGLILTSIIMIITIQKSLQLYYKQKMLVKDLEETKAELEDKKKEVEALEKENLEFSKVSHSIAHKQKALEYKLNELSMKSEIAEEMNLKDRIDDLSKELRKETIVVLDKTGITEIDDMFSYMQAECVKNKIDFQLQLSGNIYKMINHYIDKKELEILIADHIKNAIIAIGYGNNINKSILVRLGKLDGSYGLYVYDSGIEFEIETLINLGKKPSTTHRDSGGTGMGFMNTFDTLRKHKASFIIEELGKPTKDNFTKVLKFKFDGKNEFKICSYRDEEIKSKDKENSLIVEKITL